MLTNIVKATRAHYAALQHRPSADRVALDYEVTGHTAGTVWVKVPREPLNTLDQRRCAKFANARRMSEMTKLMNRLRAMYPEAQRFSAEYRDAPSTTPMLDGQRYLQSQSARS